MSDDHIKKVTLKVIDNFNKMEGGHLPDTKVIRMLRQFAVNDFENFSIKDDVPDSMKKDLTWFHLEMSRDGGKSLTLEQLAKASHLYNKKANYIRFKYACILSYKNWAKRFFESQLNLKLIEGDFPKNVSTVKAKEAYLFNELEKDEKNDNKKLLMALQNTITLCESLILLYEDDSQRTDRELTTLNRLSESRVIEQKMYGNNRK